MTQTGSSFHYSLGLLADKYGFKLAKVELLPMQFAVTRAALKGETVDAALLVSTARKLIETTAAPNCSAGSATTPWQRRCVTPRPRR